MPAGTILMGVIGKPHGVRGQVHVHSYAAHAADLAEYGPFSDESGHLYTLCWTGTGIARIARRIEGTDHPVVDRDAAARLVNTRLYVPRDRLPPPAAEEFYLADLVGLTARLAGGDTLGTVAAVHDYGAGAVIEVATPGGDMLLPFTQACVPVVDVASGTLVVHPPEELEADEQALRAQAPP